MLETQTWHTPYGGSIQVFLTKNVPIDSPKVCTKFQVSSTIISTGRSSEPKIFFFKNACMDPPKVCTKFGVYSTLLIKKSGGVAAAAAVAVGAGLYKSRGSHKHSSRTNNTIQI